MASPSDLRKQLRAQRRALSPELRSEFSARICAHLLQSKLLRARRRVAAYLPMDGEVDLAEFVDFARASNRRVFLPVIMSPFQNHLRFAPYPDSCTFRRNRFGIPEPVAERWQLVGAASLDAVLVPLVGFDSVGNRLGMGGGFYDRTLAFRLHRKRWCKPLLVGVAFEAQRVSGLAHNAWDVPLDHIVTEVGWVL